jgi:hypothetical protein
MSAPGSLYSPGSLSTKVLCQKQRETILNTGCPSLMWKRVLYSITAVKGLFIKREAVTSTARLKVSLINNCFKVIVSQTQVRRASSEGCTTQGQRDSSEDYTTQCQRDSSEGYTTQGQRHSSEGRTTLSARLIRGLHNTGSASLIRGLHNTGSA